MLTLTPQTLITVAAVAAAVLALLGYYNRAHSWYLKQEKQDKDIKAIKREQTLVVYALSACLDGLGQLGANHAVPTAKEKLDKYINQQAHDQLDD